MSNILKNVKLNKGKIGTKSANDKSRKTVVKNDNDDWEGDNDNTGFQIKPKVQNKNDEIEEPEKAEKAKTSKMQKDTNEEINWDDQQKVIDEENANIVYESSSEEEEIKGIVRSWIPQHVIQRESGANINEEDFVDLNSEAVQNAPTKNKTQIVARNEPTNGNVMKPPMFTSQRDDGSGFKTRELELTPQQKKQQELDQLDPSYSEPRTQLPSLSAFKGFKGGDGFKMKPLELTEQQKKEFEKFDQQNAETVISNPEEYRQEIFKTGTAPPKFGGIGTSNDGLKVAQLELSVQDRKMLEISEKQEQERKIASQEMKSNQDMRSNMDMRATMDKPEESSEKKDLFKSKPVFVGKESGAGGFKFKELGQDQTSIKQIEIEKKLQEEKQKALENQERIEKERESRKRENVERQTKGGEGQISRKVNNKEDRQNRQNQKVDEDGFKVVSDAKKKDLQKNNGFRKTDNQEVQVTNSSPKKEKLMDKLRIDSEDEGQDNQQ